MKKLAPIFVCIAGTLWGSMGIFVRRYNASGLASMEIVALRCIITAIIMFFVLFIYDKKMLRIRFRDIWCFVGTGILSIVFFNYSYFKAISMTSLAVAAILLYTAPAFVMLLSYFLFREKITKVKLLSLIATFIGCVLVTGILSESTTINAAGVLAGLSAGLGYALYSIFSRFALERGYGSLTISFYTFLFASVGCLFLADLKKTTEIAFYDTCMVIFSIAFALISTVLPYIIYTVGLSFMENGKAAVIASVEPVVATLLGVFLFHEKMSGISIVGMLLVLGAVAGCNLEKKADKAFKTEGI